MSKNLVWCCGLYLNGSHDGLVLVVLNLIYKLDV